jgi:predicted ester cyclase
VADLSIEDNKTMVRRFIEEVMNDGNSATIAELCVPGSRFAGGIAGQMQSMRTAFPDNHITIDDLVAEDALVAVRVTVRGTNSGPLVGLPAFGRLEQPVPPTGKTVLATGIYIFKFTDGRIASLAFELDQVGMLQQMGWTLTPPGA